MKSFLCATALLLIAASSLHADPPRPNILYFYVDDMGWGSIGPNGQAARRAKGLPSVQSPNIDKLAAEGINFTRCYGATVCSPARSSQQTGFHQGHTFADRNDPINAKKAIRADDITMGDALSKAGYATGYWGKWGYGGSKDQENPVIENIQTLPNSHGYEHVLTELHHVRAHTFFQPTLWKAPFANKAGIELAPNSMAKYADKPNYPQLPAHQNHADYPATAYCDDAYCYAALDFVRTQAQQSTATGQPFFGLLAVQIPHAPFDEIATLPEWDEAYRDDPHFAKLAEQSQQWAAMVTRIDAHFGNILTALEDPNGDGDKGDSVADNTLVIFMSDNGGPGGKNNTELDANGGLRGNKGSIYEGGIRVPTVMRWPAKIHSSSPLKAGTGTDRVTDVTDLLPTFCELAGAPVPLGLDGVSLASTLTGDGEQRVRDFLIHEAGNSASIIRGRHKLVRSMVKEKKQKKANINASFQLYDLEADHAEENDISAANKELTSELKQLLLGERVTEPKGFANTYHRWEGKDGANTSDADNWSGYVYQNKNITYLIDEGAPQLSWTAVMDSANTAKADKDLEFLGLEIANGQTLALGKGINLTGRNEIRVSEGGTLTVDGGTASSLRWIDVKEGGTLKGKGKIDGTLYSGGTVEVAVSDTDAQTVRSFQVLGSAHLSGRLEFTIGKKFHSSPGTTIRILEAQSIHGTFANPDNIVTVEDGRQFLIRYSEREVTATLLPAST